MALFPCPECRKEISEHAESCPQCGYKLAPGEGTKFRKRRDRLLKIMSEKGIEETEKRKRKEKADRYASMALLISLMGLAVFLFYRC